MSALYPDRVLRCMSPVDRAKLGKGGLLAAEFQKIAEAKSEKQLQQQLEALLRRNDVVCIRQRMDRKSNTAEGLPDILFAVGGKAIAWEVKMPGKNPTAEQLKQHAAMTRNGWEVRIIPSYDEGLHHLQELLHHV